MDVKNALRDWRIPAIFAVPILLWAGLLYLILQPLPGSGVAAAEGSVTITMSPTPSPWHQVKGTPYPSVPPQTPPPDVCAHQTTGYITETVNGVVVNVWPGKVCSP